MRKYQSGAAASVPVLLADPATGSALTPSAVRWRLLDALDAVLIDWVAVPDPQALEESLVVPIPAEQMTLTQGEGVVSGRAIHVEVTDTDTGETVLLHETILVSANIASPLTPGVNSFQTYTQAVVQAAQIPDATLGASKEHACAALAEAWRRICSLKFRVLRSATQGHMSEHYDRMWSVDLKELSSVEWGLLPVQMKISLCRAQVMEAQAILEGDALMEARSRGVVSMTVGESSQFYGTSRPLDLGVTPRAIKEIGPWVDYSIRITRA